MGDLLVVRMAARRIGMDGPGGEMAYISHAHSDHTQALGGPAPVFCSDITADILRLGEPEKNERKNEEKKEAGPAGFSPPLPAAPRRARKPRSFSSVEPPLKLPQARIPVPEGIELHEAGHILGSTQLAGMSEAYGRLAYTGDFKLRDGLTVKGAPILSCDTLFAECTYGDPAVAFPALEEVLEDMERWGRQNKEAIQLWGGYSTGKAQELVKFINDYLGEAPVVGGRAAAVCAAYRRNGVKLEWLEPGCAEAQEAMRGAFRAVMPPHQLTPLLAGRLAAVHRRKVRSVLATGWASVRPLPAHAAFPLSDHADFGEILQYAKESGARRVIMAHGDNEKTAAALRAAGVNAQAIESLGPQQMILRMEK